MKIYILRHGQTEWNRIKRMQGQTDIALNENGRELAQKVGETLGKLPFSRVISSPLQRAVETARLVLGGRKIPIETDARIGEISFGDYEGLSMINPDYPLPDPDFHFFFDAPERYQAPPKGESIKQLIERTGDFLRELASSEVTMTEMQREERILLSTHGAALRALLANIEHTDIAHFWRGCVPPNCAVSIVQFRDEKWKILECDRLYYQGK